jgi:hypothetical protein
MNFYRQGLLDEFRSMEKLSFYSATQNSMRGLNTSYYLYELIENNYSRENVKNIHYYLVSFIPRRIYSNKPITSFNVRTTQNFYAYRVGESINAIVRTYTLPGEGYIQFGMVGVFLFTFLAVYLTRMLIYYLIKINYSEFIITNIVFSIIINFRSAFDSFFYTMAFQLIYIIPILILFSRKISKVQTNGMDILIKRV